MKTSQDGKQGVSEHRSLSHRIQNERRGQVTGSRTLMRPEPSGCEEIEYESGGSRGRACSFHRRSFSWVVRAAVDQIDFHWYDVWVVRVERSHDAGVNEIV